MSTPVKYYLAAYNAIAFIFWALYFVYFISCGLQLDAMGLLLLNVAQGMALLEVVHAMLKWVKSPVGSTFAQVASRLLVLMLINFFFKGPEPMAAITKAGIITVSFAWSITELVRYSYYFLLLFDKHPRVLLLMRYSFFIVLYPTGVLGEWLIIITPIVLQPQLSMYLAFVVVLFVAYAYYFPVLYKYMWKQRRQRL